MNYFTNLPWGIVRAGSGIQDPGLGVGAAVAGLAAARVWDLAPGGTIVLVASGVFLLTSVPGLRRIR